MNQRPEPANVGGQPTTSTAQQPPAGGVASGPSTNEGLQPVSSMPIPPMQYVKLYTDENVRRGSAPGVNICSKIQNLSLDQSKLLPRFFFKTNGNSC